MLSNAKVLKLPHDSHLNGEQSSHTTLDTGTPLVAHTGQMCGELSFLVFRAHL